MKILLWLPIALFAWEGFTYSNWIGPNSEIPDRYTTADACFDTLSQRLPAIIRERKSSNPIAFKEECDELEKRIEVLHYRFKAFRYRLGQVLSVGWESTVPRYNKNAWGMSSQIYLDATEYYDCLLIDACYDLRVPDWQQDQKTEQEIEISSFDIAHLFKINLIFSDQTKKQIDLQPIVGKNWKVQLASPDYFNKVSSSNKNGLYWPDCEAIPAKLLYAWEQYEPVMGRPSLKTDSKHPYCLAADINFESVNKRLNQIEAELQWYVDREHSLLEKELASSECLQYYKNIEIIDELFNVYNQAEPDQKYQKHLCAVKEAFPLLEMTMREHYWGTDRFENCENATEQADYEENMEVLGWAFDNYKRDDEFAKRHQNFIELKSNIPLLQEAFKEYRDYLTDFYGRLCCLKYHRDWSSPADQLSYLDSSHAALRLTEWYISYVESMLFPQGWDLLYEAYLENDHKLVSYEELERRATK